MGETSDAEPTPAFLFVSWLAQVSDTVPVHFSALREITDLKQLGNTRVYFSLQTTDHHWEKTRQEHGGKNWNRDLRGILLIGLFNLVSYTNHAHKPGGSAATVGDALLHQMLIKEMSPEICPRTVWWRQFPSWHFLSPGYCFVLSSQKLTSADTMMEIWLRHSLCLFLLLLSLLPFFPTPVPSPHQLPTLSLPRDIQFLGIILNTDKWMTLSENLNGFHLSVQKFLEILLAERLFE